MLRNLLETTAEVPRGLETALVHYRGEKEKAWKP